MKFLSIVAALALAGFAAAQTDFGQTCHSISIHDTGNDVDLTATCTNEGGGEVTSTIGLDSCLTNNNGGLQCAIE